MRTRQTFFAAAMVAVLAIAGVAAAVAAGPASAPPPRIAFLANGMVPADALAAGPVAGQLGAPIFTTQRDSLPGDTAAALSAYAPELVVVLGGPVAIDDSVVNAAAAATGLRTVAPTPLPTTGVVRAAGSDRFATAVAVADLLAAYAPAYLPVDLQAVDADLLDGRDSSNFLSAGGKAADSHLLDGRDSSNFLGAGGKAADSDLLDGLDARHVQWPDHLPTGRTMTGTYAINFRASSANEEGTDAISFSVPLANGPTQHYIVEGGTPPGGCPGSAEDPEADPGHLCVYETRTTNTSRKCLARLQPQYICDAVTAGTVGTSVFVTSAASGQTVAVGTWAVTASEEDAASTTAHVSTPQSDLLPAR